MMAKKRVSSSARERRGGGGGGKEEESNHDINLEEKEEHGERVGERGKGSKLTCNGIAEASNRKSVLTNWAILPLPRSY